MRLSTIRTLFAASLLAIPGLALAQSAPPPLMYQNPDTANAAGTFSFAALTLNQQTGAVSPAPGSPFATNASLQAMAIDPLGRFLYAVNPQANNIAMFAIDQSTGALTQVPNSPFAVPGSNNPQFVAADSSGKFVYVGASNCTNPTLGCIDVYAVDRTNNALVAPAQANLTLPGRVAGLAANPSFPVLYVYVGPDNSGHYNALVNSYNINPANGSLSLGVQASQGQYGRVMAMDRKARYLVTGHGLNIGQLEDWGISPVDGSLASFPSPPPPGQSPITSYGQGEFPNTISTDGTGNYLYVGTSQGLYIYSVNTSDGVLTAVAGSPFAAIGSLPAANLQLIADPQGPYMYVGSNSQIYGFQVDPQTGLLAPLPGSPFVTHSSGGGGYLVFNVPSGVQPVAGPAITLFPASLQLDSTAIGTASGPKVTSIVSAGQQALSVNSISVAGTNAGDFSETDTCHAPAVLQPATNCSVSVTFAPTAAGVRQASLNIADNAAGSPQSVALSGTGVAPQPAVTLLPGSLAFPATATGVSSKLTVTLTNSGQTPLSVTNTALSGANTADFSLNNHCTAQLAVNGACGIDVTFSPVAQGHRSATLTITDNAGMQTVSLSGSGAAAFALAAAANGATSATVSGGQTAQYNLQVTAGPGYSGTVALACTGAPTAATCQVNPASVNVSNAAATPFTVSVTTTGHGFAAPHEWPAPAKPALPLTLSSLALILAAILFALYRSRSVRGWDGDGPRPRAISAFAALVLAGIAFASTAGCGGGSTAVTPPPQQVVTPKGTVTLTITATASSEPQVALNLSLTVN
jgi:hypothetical protein